MAAPPQQRLEALLGPVREAVEGLRGPGSPQAPAALVALAGTLLPCLEDGLKGNRAVGGTVWSVVGAAQRAFPIQLSASVEKAQAVAAGSASASLVETWVAQAAADGSLAVLLQGLRSQPQILTAYDRGAAVRDAAVSAQLLALLQRVKEIGPPSPYDALAASKPAQPAPRPVAPIHIETEDDLPRHHHQHQQQQQQQQQQHDPAGGGAGSSGRSTPSGGASSSGGGGHASAPGTHRRAADGVGRGAAPGGLAGRLGDTRLPIGAMARRAPSGGSSAGLAAATPAEPAVRVQLQVAAGGSRNPGGPVVRLLLQVAADGAGAQRAYPAGGAAGGAKLFVGAGAGAVKGLLQGIHHSASAGLQQSAAAGQELGGVVAAAISQPLATVRGLAARAGRKGDGKAGGGGGGVSPRSPAQPPSAQPAAVAAAAPPPLLRVQLRASGDPSRPVALVIAPRAGPCDGGAPSRPGSSSGSSSGVGASWSTRKLLGKLSVSRGSRDRGGSGEADGQQQQAGSGSGGGGEPLAAAAGPGGDAADQDLLEGDVWSVMARLRRAGGGRAAAAARPAAGGGPGSASAAGLPSATGAEAAEAAEAAAAALQEQGRLLLERLLASCGAVVAAAAASKGSLGEESPELLQLLALLRELLNHGLRSAPGSSPAAAAPGEAGNGAGGRGAGSSAGSRGASATSAAREVLGSLLQAKPATAFGVLQLLQQGGKQHARLMLGADGIATMKAARGCPPAVKLELWLRASLNEQLLGCRLSALASSPTALSVWYAPQALLLQQEQMQRLLLELSRLGELRFALPVEGAPAAAGERGTAASLNPGRLLGGLGGAGLAALGVGSGAAAAAAAAAAAPAAAAGGEGGDAGSVADTRSGSSSSSIPTFLWGALGGGGGSSSNAADGGGAGGSGLFRRRRLADIREVRVPPPDSAAVLSSEASSALSPVSAAGDAEFAEWWSPNGSWQDLAAGGGGGEDAGAGPLGSRGGSANSLGAAAEPRRAGSGGAPGPGASGGEAALRLEQELSAAMAEPLMMLAAAERSRRSTQGSSGGGGASGSSSSSGGGGRRSGSAEQRGSDSGWEAAVAAARSHGRPGGPRLPGLHQHALQLHRRSRSPDAAWPSAAPGGGGGGGPGAGPGARTHRHKRSSSLNDLPELEALLQAGELPPAAATGPRP